MNYRVYEKANENGLFLCPTYFRTKHEAVEHAKMLNEPILQRKGSSNWFNIPMPKES